MYSPTDTHYKPHECPVCEGSGVLVIKNAYDPDYEERELCEACDGLGYIYTRKDLTN